MWLYSAPPLRLHSTGLGELDAALVVTTLGPFFAFYLQVPDLVGLRTLLLAILPLCCLQFAMILAVEVPDAIGDSMVGKRTLVVRLGRPRAVRWYATVVFIAYAALPILVAAGLPMAVALAAALFAPLATWQIWSVRGGRALRPESWEGLTFWSAALFVLTAAAELAGFLLMVIGVCFWVPNDLEIMLVREHNHQRGARPGSSAPTVSDARLDTAGGPNSSNLMAIARHSDGNSRPDPISVLQVSEFACAEIAGTKAAVDAS